MTVTDRFAERSGAPVLTRMWWVLLLRGLAILAFGLVVFFGFSDSLQALARAFAAYAAVDGILSVIGAKLAGGFSARRGLALAGLVSILAGIAAGAWSPLTIPNFVIIVGLWAVVSGALEFGAALKLRQMMERDWSLVMIGGFSIALGVILLIHRDYELGTLVRMLSAYALITGALMLLLAYRFKRGLRP